ncbi:MAG TPA: DOMON-like domain-containing protein [Gammaproteobacteria bacterium]
MQKLELKAWHSREGDAAGTAEAGMTLGAEITTAQAGLHRFRYLVRGSTSGLRIPAPVNPERRHELWRHTCFEAFVMQPDGSYYEFNFSPSTQWALYRFDGYRRAMTEPSLPSAPRIDLAVIPDSLVLDATLDLQGLLDPAARSRPRVALAAVIEDSDGRLSYWALTHPAEKPDFHHPDGFIAALPDNDD